MASVLLRTGEESVTLTAREIKTILDRGDGDAALLYLALLRHNGNVPPRALAGELRWEKGRIEAAEEALKAMGLIASAEITVPEPADERPNYQRDDIALRLEESAEFRSLVSEVEKKLGKKLTDPDNAMLLGLHDYLGLPEDVIYLLVNHCIQRIQRQYGEGRRPTVRQIEKEGYAWARKGIDTQRAAADYLKNYARRQETLPASMRVLQLGDRLPVASEEKFLLAWQEWGFSPDAVALAYDKTVMKCREMKWPYCNGILKRWHEKGLHTVEEIESENRPAMRGEDSGQNSRNNEELRKYVQELHRDRR